MLFGIERDLLRRMLLPVGGYCRRRRFGEIAGDHRPARGRQEGQPGNLLRHPRAITTNSSARDGGMSTRPARS